MNGNSAVNGNAKVNGDSVVNGKVHPWLSLSPSAFKRLTAKDLSEFLEERGVSSTSKETGKRLLKKDLLEEVKKIL